MSDVTQKLFKKKWCRVLRRTLAALLLLAIPIVSIGCGSAVPTPPVEIPSPVVLKFVKSTDLSVNVAAISETAVGPGGEYSDIIPLGYEFSTASDQILAVTMQLLTTFEIPISTATTRYEQDGVDSAGVVHHAKFDFADFDIDNDGASEGCSGNTGALPICVRLWIDDERFVAWIFDAYPLDDDPATAANEATIGSGRFKLFIDNSYGFGIALYVLYAQDDTGGFRKQVEQYDRAALLAEGALPSDAPWPTGLERYDIHMRIVEEGLAPSAFKSVNFTVNTISQGAFADFFGATLEEQLLVRYIGQFLDDQDYWGGSSLVQLILDAGTLTLFDETDICARISTAMGVDHAFCEELGIAVGDTAYVDPLQDADVAVPTDFPATPTF